MSREELLEAVLSGYQQGTTEKKQMEKRQKNEPVKLRESEWMAILWMREPQTSIVFN